MTDLYIEFQTEEDAKDFCLRNPGISYLPGYSRYDGRSVYRCGSGTSLWAIKYEEETLLPPDFTLWIVFIGHKTVEQYEGIKRLSDVLESLDYFENYVGYSLKFSLPVTREEIERLLVKFSGMEDVTKHINVTPRRRTKWSANHNAPVDFIVGIDYNKLVNTSF